MKRLSMSFVLAVGMLAVASTGHAQTVQYVKICSIYGAGFHYIPGTDICLNDETGDARVQTAGGTWRSLLPYPEGEWVTNAKEECASDKLVKIGTFQSTDFTTNAWDRKQTPPVTLILKKDEFISKVIMSGGFYDPRAAGDRHGVNGFQGLCLRSIDPTVLEVQGSDLVNPPFGNGFLPIGCVANSRIVGMPAAYAISATAAYPDIDTSFDPTLGTIGPYTYGRQLVVTTDLGPNNFIWLTYSDGTEAKPLAGTLTASVCIADSHGRHDRDR